MPIIYAQYLYWYWYFKVTYWYWYWYWYLFVEYLIQDCVSHMFTWQSFERIHFNILTTNRQYRQVLCIPVENVQGPRVRSASTIPTGLYVCQGPRVQTSIGQRSFASMDLRCETVLPSTVLCATIAISFPYVASPQIYLSVRRNFIA